MLLHGIKRNVLPSLCDANTWPVPGLEKTAGEAPGRRTGSSSGCRSGPPNNGKIAGMVGWPV